MLRKVLRLLVCMLFLLTSYPVFAADNITTSNSSISTDTVVTIKTEMKIGDYVIFGKYNKKPILWRVINIDSKGGPVLFSEKIISLKAFDAAESGISGNNLYRTHDRQLYGSNRWKNSNLREWLNSSAKKVKYSTQPPIKRAVFRGYDAYANEPGFLSNFTIAERNSIKAVTRKSILANIDKSYKDGGKSLFVWEDNLEKAVSNYDTAYYENVTDKVYLLNFKELRDFVYKRGWEYKKIPTQEAVDKSNRKAWFINSNDYFSYLLAVPSASFPDSQRDVFDFPNDEIMSCIANFPSGVVPALALKSSKFKSGSGTIEDPYIP